MKDYNDQWKELNNELQNGDALNKNETAHNPEKEQMPYQSSEQVAGSPFQSDTLEENKNAGNDLTDMHAESPPPMSQAYSVPETEPANSNSDINYHVASEGIPGSAPYTNNEPPPSMQPYPNYSSSNDYSYYSGYGYQPNTGFTQTYTQSQPQSAQSAESARAAAKPRRKKKVSVGTLIACTLAAAVVGGGMGTAGYMVADRYLADNSSDLVSTDTGDESSPDVNIVSNETAKSLVSAINKKVSPSVVGIQTTGSTYDNGFFFGQDQSSVSEGSGIVYSSDGYIVTNYHVIQAAVESSNALSAKIEVFFESDPETGVEASVIGYDATNDLAVLKVEKTGLTAVDLGDSDALEVGQTVVAIGCPGGLDFMGSVSSGVISGLDRTIQLESGSSLIQTDAAINPGNSGGALVDGDGKLVGIPSSKISAEGYEGMGFAIPVNTVKEICDDIIQNKDVKKPYLGLQINTQYDAETLQSMGYPAGIVVENVVTGGPCANAGIQRGDIITKIGGVEISDYEAFDSEKNKYSPGDTVELEIYRSGQTATVSVTLGESN